MIKKNERNVINFKKNSFIEIDVNEDIDINEYKNAICRYNVQLPLKSMINEVIDMHNIKIKKQKIIIIEFKQNKITISFDNNEIKILEISCANEDDFIDETFITLSDTINVTKNLYNEELDTVITKTYPNYNPHTQAWTLEKDEAILLIKSLMHFILHITDINEMKVFNQVKQTIDELEKDKQKTIPNI